MGASCIAKIVEACRLDLTALDGGVRATTVAASSIGVVLKGRALVLFPPPSAGGPRRPSPPPRRRRRARVVAAARRLAAATLAAGSSTASAVRRSTLPQWLPCASAALDLCV